MTRIERYLLSSAAATFAVGLILSLKSAPPRPRPANLAECHVIHKDGQPCPDGWNESSAYFEKDGRKIPACTDPNKPSGRVDRIEPGEAFIMRFELELPEPDAPAGVGPQI